MFIAWIEAYVVDYWLSLHYSSKSSHSCAVADHATHFDCNSPNCCRLHCHCKLWQSFIRNVLIQGIAGVLQIGGVRLPDFSVRFANVKVDACSRLIVAEIVHPVQVPSILVRWCSTFLGRVRSLSIWQHAQKVRPCDCNAC